MSIDSAWVPVIVVVIATVGSVVVGLMGWTTARANRLDDRLTKLWGRVDRLESDLEEEREYNRRLSQHIWDGKPPPPPPRSRTN